MTHFPDESAEFLTYNNDQISLHVNATNPNLNIVKHFGVFQGSLCYFHLILYLLQLCSNGSHDAGEYNAHDAV